MWPQSLSLTQLPKGDTHPNALRTFPYHPQTRYLVNKEGVEATLGLCFPNSEMDGLEPHALSGLCSAHGMAFHPSRLSSGATSSRQPSLNLLLRSSNMSHVPPLTAFLPSLSSVFLASCQTRNSYQPSSAASSLQITHSQAAPLSPSSAIFISLPGLLRIEEVSVKCCSVSNT